MNLWLWSATILMLGLVMCGALITRGGLMSRLVALEMAGTVSVLVLLLLAKGFQQPSYFDVALALAVLAFPASLVFAHFLERWL